MILLDQITLNMNSLQIGYGGCTQPQHTASQIVLIQQFNQHDSRCLDFGGATATYSVPEAGVEPARRPSSAQGPEPCMSANSITPARVDCGSTRPQIWGEAFASFGLQPKAFAVRAVLP